MAQRAAVRKVIEAQAGEELKIPGFAGGGPPAASREPVVSNARLGLLMFLGAEAMFFAGLIGAFLVFRLGSSVWPPPFQPRLPTAVTGINTVVLLASGLTVQLALRAVRLGSTAGLVRYVWTTLLLGGVFLAVQGSEWVRLIRFGLTVSSGVYAQRRSDPGSQRPFHEAEAHRGRDLRHVLDLCGGPLADTLRLGVPVLIKDDRIGYEDNCHVCMSYLQS
ncbi:MAG: heme-copper oxidase subunit III [Deltaproteobacteria bacterium]|nr:heme-copper oxidase subunit III [Deltaproteobacteria bacterium]